MVVMREHRIVVGVDGSVPSKAAWSGPSDRPGYPAR